LFFKKEGFPKGIYIRIGSNTRRANQEYIEDLVREGNRLYFDEEHIPEKLCVKLSSMLLFIENTLSQAL
jgi:ATP-dependent DNA helicase RecG